MTNSLLVWFQLYDAGTGLPFKGKIAAKVSLDKTADVDDFRDAVKIKNPIKLSHVDANDLLVYKNKSSFDKRNLQVGREEPLEEDSSIANLGISKKEALIVVVPSTDQDEMEIEFNPANYSVPLGPEFIQRNGIPKRLLGREEQLRSIDDFMKWADDKGRVVSMGTTRGMGKTTMCKYLAETHQNAPLNQARAVGRLLLYDMTEYHSQDPDRLWRDLIVHHLCYIFNGCTVGGIKFQKLDMRQVMNRQYHHTHSTFSSWANDVMTGTITSIHELIRLTNIAFGVTESQKCEPVWPVFILDEVQTFIHVITPPTCVLPAGAIVDTRTTKTALALALTSLGPNGFVVVAGIVDGNLSLIADGTRYSVQNVYLSPFSTENQFRYGEAERCPGDRWPSSLQEFHEDHKLMSLMSLTYGIPRLCMIAVKKIWSENLDSLNDMLVLYIERVRNSYIQAFDTVERMEISQLSYIVMACGCGLKARLTNFVPNTNVTWRKLIESAVVFPSGRTFRDTQSFIFPIFVLGSRKRDVKAFVAKLINGADITKCFFDYSEWAGKSIQGPYDIGIWWEEVVVNSLAIKYHLVSLSHQGPICLSDLYDFEGECVVDLQIRLDAGITLNVEEMDVNGFVKSPSLFHQKNINNAKYDFLCSQSAERCFKLLPAQCKNTLQQPTTKTLEDQLNDCEHLLWIYPGFTKGDEKNLLDSHSELVRDAVKDKKLIFLNGYGCCCTLTIDMITLLKNALQKRNGN